LEKSAICCLSSKSIYNYSGSGWGWTYGPTGVVGISVVVTGVVVVSGAGASSWWLIVIVRASPKRHKKTKIALFIVRI